MLGHPRDSVRVSGELVATENIIEEGYLPFPYLVLFVKQLREILWSELAHIFKMIKKK